MPPASECSVCLLTWRRYVLCWQIGLRRGRSNFAFVSTLFGHPALSPFTLQRSEVDFAE